MRFGWPPGTKLACPCPPRLVFRREIARNESLRAPMPTTPGYPCLVQPVALPGGEGQLRGVLLSREILRVRAWHGRYPARGARLAHIGAWGPERWSENRLPCHSSSRCAFFGPKRADASTLSVRRFGPRAEPIGDRARILAAAGTMTPRAGMPVKGRFAADRQGAGGACCSGWT